MMKVKSNGNPFTKAQTDPTNQFSAWVPAIPGQNTITIEAKDDSPNANTKTQSYSVNVTGQSRTPSFDLNGNITNNGTGQTYAWDAEDRLVKITYADYSKTEFSYDGSSRRTRIIEKSATNTVTSDRRYLWAGGTQPAEERDATGAITLKQYFGQGEKRIGGADAGSYYYAQDHLGSIREITDSAGTLRARYDYDFWGKRVKLAGTLETEVGYTSHHHHAKSGLVITHFRAYNPELGTWLSADPIGEAGGMNLYGYVGNDPVNGWDPLGLDRWVCGAGHTSVVVEDPLSSTGYHRYAFGPENWYGALHGAGRMYKTEVNRPNPRFSMRIPSTPTQDSVLIQVGDDYNKTPTSYNLVGSNCRHHSSVLKDAGMGAKHNPFIFTPFLSSPWIQPR